VVTFRHDYGLALMLSRDRGAPRRTRPEEKDRSMRNSADRPVRTQTGVPVRDIPGDNKDENLHSF
jgi:hypothetical protein